MGSKLKKIAKEVHKKMTGSSNKASAISKMASAFVLTRYAVKKKKGK